MEGWKDGWIGAITPLACVRTQSPDGELEHVYPLVHLQAQVASEPGCGGSQGLGLAHQQQCVQGIDERQRDAPLGVGALTRNRPQVVLCKTRQEITVCPASLAGWVSDPLLGSVACILCTPASRGEPSAYHLAATGAAACAAMWDESSLVQLDQVTIADKRCQSLMSAPSSGWT